jgi:probable F420-dependent oxidoreductase
MKFGLAFASSVGTGMDSALEICRAAEKLGFDSVWGGEHVIRPDAITSPYPYTEDGEMPGEAETAIPDPLIWLAYVAAAAPTLRLGTCILILPQRNPLVLAKELATLDQLSGGRVELGIGVGWMREEFEALGIPWERRGARTDEYIGAMRALWSGPHAEYHGEFVDFPPATCSPRPVQDPLPVIVGGDTPAAVRRAARLGNGYFPGTVDLERLKILKGDLGQAAEAEGRDPADIGIHTLFGPQLADPRAGAEALADLGVDRVMVPAFFFIGPAGLDNLARFAETTIQPLTSHTPA